MATDVPGHSFVCWTVESSREEMGQMGSFLRLGPLRLLTKTRLPVRWELTVCVLRTHLPGHHLSTAAEPRCGEDGSFMLLC